MLSERDTDGAQPGSPAKTQRPAKRPQGRPSLFDPDIAQAICDAYASSALSLPQVLNSSPSFPSWTTLYRWEDAHEGFRRSLARAREQHADFLVSECGQIADNQHLGEKVKVWKGEREVTTADMIEHRKLRIDTRMRLAKFLNPAKYGDRVEVSGTVTLEALILASMKLDEPRKPAAIEGKARVVEAPAGPVEDEDGAL